VYPPKSFSLWLSLPLLNLGAGNGRMIFKTIPLVTFFIIIPLFYFWIPYRHRWTFLLLASGAFYLYHSWRWEYLSLLFLLTLINYSTALWMEGCKSSLKKKTFFSLSILSNLGILFLFKYFIFFSHSIGTIFDSPSIWSKTLSTDFILPVGISFYTFKNLSYSIDVYRTHQKPERHFGIYALYVAFFPQILAGPIERATRFLPQFYERFNFDDQRIASGFKLIFWGIFQKLVIADNLGLLVDPIYNHPAQFQGLSLTLATVFFAFQIFCDFSGYSDMAIGLGQVMGFKTMANFNRPYLSTSVAEFWRRWHISLSTWLRDYLYIPLGGNRVPALRWYWNLFFVFLICGLWHGANWTFILWGGLHGFFLIFSIMTQSIRRRANEAIGLDHIPKLHHFLKILTTFFLVCFAWIFFRANNISDALYIISHLGVGWSEILHWETLKSALGSQHNYFQWMVGVASIGFIMVTHFLQRRGRIMDRLAQEPVLFRWAIYYVLILAFLLLRPSETRMFIYFQF
jgi:alginate O-acetyltransferase complex protein AlgI